MALYVLKRILLTIPVLFATAMLIFFIFQLIPGDVVQASMTQKLMTAEQQNADEGGARTQQARARAGRRVRRSRCSRETWGVRSGPASRSWTCS